jgi:hypothetical protein
VKPSSENNSGNINNETASAESAIPSDSTREIHSPEDYKNPELKGKTWCSYMERGFRASRTITDTQSGVNTEDSGHPEK